MKNINNIKIWALAAIIMIGQSCGDFLDVDPPY